MVEAVPYWVLSSVRTGNKVSIFMFPLKTHFFPDLILYLYCFVNSYHWHLEWRFRRKREKWKERHLPLPCLCTWKGLLMSVPIVWIPCLYLSFAIYTFREITENWNEAFTTGQKSIAPPSLESKMYFQKKMNFIWRTHTAIGTNSLKD